MNTTDPVLIQSVKAAAKGAALQVDTLQMNFPSLTKGVPLFDYQDATLKRNPDCSEYAVAPPTLSFNPIFLPLSGNSSKCIARIAEPRCS